MEGKNPTITGDINTVKYGTFIVNSGEKSTVSLIGNVFNSNSFSLGYSGCKGKETLSLSDGYTFTNTGSLFVNEGSFLDGRVNNIGGTIQGTGTIRDLHVNSADTSTVFSADQVNVKNLYLENNAVMTRPKIFFETLNGGTFNVTENNTLTQKSLSLNNATLDLGNFRHLLAEGGNITITLNNSSLKNGYINSDIILQSSTNVLDNIEVYGNIINEKESIAYVKNVDSYDFVNKGVLNVSEGSINFVTHAGGIITGTGGINMLFINEDVPALSSIVTDTTTIGWLIIGNNTLTYDDAVKAKISEIYGGNLILGKDLSIDAADFGRNSLNIGTKTLNVAGWIGLSSTDVYISVEGINPGEYGQIRANEVLNAKPNLIVSVKSGLWQKNETKELPLIVANSFIDDFTLVDSPCYKIERTATPGTYAITCLQTAADIVVSGGGKQNVQEQASVWDALPTEGTSTTQGEIASTLSQLSNTVGKEKEYVEALTTLAPNEKPIAQIQSVDTTVSAINTVTQRINKRMSISQVPQRASRRSRTYYRRSGRGRSGGAPSLTDGLWVQGLYNKTEFNVQDGFESTTAGIAGGYDTRTQNGLVGFALSFAEVDTEESAGRKTDATLYTGMLYGEYRSKHFFMDGILSATYGDYEERKNVSGINVAADYGVYTAGGQLLFGYEQKGFSPLLGARYFYAYQEDYEDGAGQEISSDGLHTATALGGLRYAPVLRAGDGVLVIPEFKVLAAYDFIEPSENKSVVNVGGSSYNVVEDEEDKLDRFGIETAAGITLDLGRLEASLRYEGAFKKDYESHTGIFELRYNF